MNEFLRDARFALRAAARSPWVLLAATGSIALGVGATTVVYTIVYGLFLRPLPLPDPGRLYTIAEDRSGRYEGGYEGPRIPYTRLLAYRAATQSAFSGLAGHASRQVSLRAQEGYAREASAALVTSNYFSVLGLHPALGAFFTRDDERAVVLGHEAWRTRFGGDPAVVGRAVYIDSKAFTVAGVMPAGFGGTVAARNLEVWIPPLAYSGAREGGPWLAPFGRLRAGVSSARAATLVDLVARRTPPDEPQTRVHGAVLVPLTPLPVGTREGAAPFMGLLFATALLVLLIAAANVAGILLARSAARRQELTIRLALGAGRARLVRQLLTESTLLFLVGGVLGFALANAAMPLIAAIPVQNLPITLAFTPDARALAFALGLTLVVALGAGVGPALHATRPVPGQTLNEESARASARARGRSLFVMAQVAMAVLLLVSAGLTARSLQKSLATNTAFDAHDVVVASVDVGPHGYDQARARAFFRQLLENVRAMPGVESAALAQVPIVGGWLNCNDVQRADAGAAAEPLRSPACYDIVDPDFFRTIRLRILSGRGLTADDVGGAPRVAVVNETLARTLWPGESALGRRYRSAGQTYTVVGIAQDAQSTFQGNTGGLYAFYPYAQHDVRSITLHARVRGDAAALLRRIRAQVNALDPNVAVERAAPWSTFVDASVLPQRLEAGFVGLFGILGLLLAALGVYGVVSFQVARRTRELGIRLALGAGRRTILALVLRSGVVLAGAGVVIGLAGAAALARLLASLLVGVSPFDPVTFVGVPLLLFAVALLASYIPARRAAALDPMTAIRLE